MADTVASQTLHDGPRNAVMKFTNISDGTGESAVTKVDVSTLSAHPQNGACTGVSLRQIDYSTAGMGVDILFDATADVLAYSLPADQSDTVDLWAIGGIPDNAGAGATGDLNFTTVNAASGDRYTVILHMVKQYAA